MINMDKYLEAIEQCETIKYERRSGMKNVSKWIEILSKHKTCIGCGSENMIPTITPMPYEYTSPHFREANSKRGIMICCNDCGALVSLDAAELEGGSVEAGTTEILNEEDLINEGVLCHECRGFIGNAVGKKRLCYYCNDEQNNERSGVLSDATKEKECQET